MYAFNRDNLLGQSRGCEESPIVLRTKRFGSTKLMLQRVNGKNRGCRGFVTSGSSSKIYANIGGCR